MGQMPESKQVRELQVQWSDKAANYVYRLVTFAEYETGERQIVNEVNGDGNRQWAEKIAKHYGIEIPEEK